MALGQGYSKIIERSPRSILIQDADAKNHGEKGCVIFVLAPLTLLGLYLLIRYGPPAAGQPAALPWGLGLVVCCPLLALYFLNYKYHFGSRISPEGITSIKSSALQKFPTRIPRETVSFIYLLPTGTNRFIVTAGRVGQPLAILPQVDARELVFQAGEMLDVPRYLSAPGSISLNAGLAMATAALTRNRPGLAAALPSVLFFDVPNRVLFGSIQGGQPIPFGPGGDLRDLNQHPFSDITEIVIVCDKDGVYVQAGTSDDSYPRQEYAFHLEFRVNGLPPIAIGNYYSSERHPTPHSRAFHDADWVANFYRTVLYSKALPTKGYPF